MASNKNDKSEFLRKSPGPEPLKNNFSAKGDPNNSLPYGRKKVFDLPKKASIQSAEPESDVVPYELKRQLHYDSKVRQDLADKLKTNLNSDKFNKAVEDLEKDLDEKVSKTFGPRFDPNEKRSFAKPQNRYWEERHELEKLQEGGLDDSEVKKIKRNKGLRDFLDKMLGIKRNT